jgi:hypothetical protein
MDDPQTFWLTVTNIAVGAATLLGVLATVGGIGYELISERRRRRAILAEIDADLRRLFASDAYDWQIRSN